MIAFLKFKKSLFLVLIINFISCTSVNKDHHVSTNEANEANRYRQPAAALGVESKPMVDENYLNPVTKMSFWQEQQALSNDKKDVQFDKILAPRLGLDPLKKAYAKKNKELVNFLIWVRANPLAAFKDLRTNQPVLKLQPLPNKDEKRNYKYGSTYVISKYKDVVEALEKPEIFTVKNYQRKMEDSVGPFMLAYDGSYYNTTEKAWMRKLLQAEDLEKIRKIVRTEVENSIQQQSYVGTHFDKKPFARLEVVNQIARRVPAILTQSYFGFDTLNSQSGTPQEQNYKKEQLIKKILEWSRATQDDFFHNVTNNPLIRDRSIKAGQEMHEHLKALYNEKKKTVSAESRQYSKSDPAFKTYYDTLDIFSRMIASQAEGTGAEKTSDESQARQRTNIIGTLVGGIETTQAAITQSLYQLLIRPEIFAQVVSAANKSDYGTVAKYVWEALRFHPVNPFVVRYVNEEYKLGDVTIPKGSHVLIATQSAMFDEEVIGSNSHLFDINNEKKRKAASSFHLGYGSHRCLGDYISEVQVPEIVMALLNLPELKKAEGQAGEIDFRIRIGRDADEIKSFSDKVSAIFTEYSNSFPEKFAVEFSRKKIKNPAAIQIADLKYPYEAYIKKYDRDLYRQCLSALELGQTPEDLAKHKSKYFKVIVNAIKTQFLNSDGSNRELMYCRTNEAFQSCMAEKMKSENFKYNSRNDNDEDKHLAAFNECSSRLEPDVEQFYRNVFFNQRIDYNKLKGDLAVRENTTSEDKKYEFEDYLLFYDRFKTKHSMLNPLGLKNMPESDHILMYTRLNIDFRMCFAKKAIIGEKVGDEKVKLSREDAYKECRNGVYEPTKFVKVGALTKEEMFFYEKVILGRNVNTIDDILN